MLLSLQSALGKLLSLQAAGQGLQLATHTSFFYAGAGGQAWGGGRGRAWMGSTGISLPPCRAACTQEAGATRCRSCASPRPPCALPYLPAGLVAALGPTVLLGGATGLIISNAWAVASDRAVKAGECVAGSRRGKAQRSGGAGAADRMRSACPWLGRQQCITPPACRLPGPPRPPHAGKLLAHLLLSGAHGDRPVRLVAHGMGARLVFHCLLELCRQGARGVVQHCVLLGCPVRGRRWAEAEAAAGGWRCRAPAA